MNTSSIAYNVIVANSQMDLAASYSQVDDAFVKR